MLHVGIIFRDSYTGGQKIIALLLLLCVFTPLLSNSQDTPKRWLGLITGGGNYETLHAGLHLSINEVHYVEGAAGLSPWSFTDDFYAMQYICYGRRVVQVAAIKSEAYVQAKIFHWEFRDEDINLSAIGIGPEIKVAYRLSRRSVMSAAGGFVYNTPIHYEIIAYDDVEWLYRFRPSFSLQFMYWLK